MNAMLLIITLCLWYHIEISWIILSKQLLWVFLSILLYLTFSSENSISFLLFRAIYSVKPSGLHAETLVFWGYPRKYWNSDDVRIILSLTVNVFEMEIFDKLAALNVMSQDVI